MTVLVTGGSGVVGAAVVRHLVAADLPVRALSRSERADEILRALGAKPVRGDVTEPDTLDRAVAGVDTVFHVAGLNEMCPRRPSDLFRVNVAGSVAMLRAADRAGVRRFVHTSSAAAVGEAHGTVGTETSPHRGSYLSHYERSKHQSESALAAVPARTELVMVLPSSVQGPGRATGTGKLILDLLRGRLPVVVDTTLSMVDIDDCARGHLLAAERGVAGERYLLNSFTLTMREAIALLESALGRPLRVRYLPGGAALVVSAVIEAGARLLRRRPPLCREMVRTVLQGHTYDGSKAERALGLSYTGPDELLARLVEWFRAEGMIDG